ncbi:MAG: hypothetical protein ACMG51_01515 [Ginsengibacter sp.]
MRGDVAPRNSLAEAKMIAAPTDSRQSFTHLLKGVFAYSYSGYHDAAGMATPPAVAPEIGSYLERTRPAMSIAGQRGWELYDEIDGYVLVDYVGWIDFHGDGKLSGGGTSRRAGANAVPFTHSGSYIVEIAKSPMLEGEMVSNSCVILTHAEQGAEDARALKFTVLDGDAGRLVAAGTMTQG